MITFWRIKMRNSVLWLTLSHKISQLFVVIATKGKEAFNRVTE